MKMKLRKLSMEKYKKEWEIQVGRINIMLNKTTQPDVLEKIVREVDYVFKITRRISNRKTKIKIIYENTNQNRI